MNLTKSLACLLVVAVALIGCPAAKVTVPNVVGQTEAAASAAILALDLTFTLTHTYSATIAAGSVISQNPVAATEVDAGSNIALVISDGPEPVETVVVPNVAGQTVAAATATLTASELVLGAQFTESSSTVATGLIIRTSPLAGATVDINSTVAVIVSTGPATTVVPEVVGSMTSDAVNAITGAQLIIGTITYQNDLQPQGTVISQTPVSGGSVLAGTAVNLVVSNGPQIVAVPDVVGDTQAVATAALTEAGLVVGTVTQQYDAGVAGLVLDQGTDAGTMVDAGSAVNITVSVAVPNVVGMTKPAAIAALAAVGITVADPANITAAAGNLNPLGTVTAQAAPGGDPIAVQLTVSARTLPAINDGVTTFATWKTNLTAAGLQLGTVSYALDITKIGTVKLSVPAAGAVTTDTAPVAVTIYTGNVPFVLGSTLAQATTTFDGNFTLDPANNAAIVLGDLVATADPLKVGTIATQTPAANTQLAVAADGTFDTTVAATVYGMQIPYVIGQNEVTASATLQAVQPANATFVALTHTVKATTEALFATVKTEVVSPGIGGANAAVPAAGVLSADSVVDIDAYGLDVRPLVGDTLAFDIVGVAVTAEADAIAAADAIVVGTTHLPYTVTYTGGLLADLGELISIKDSAGAAITNAAADAGPFYTSIKLEISGLLALPVVGKQIGVSGDNVAADTAWGILTGAAQVVASKFPVGNIVVNNVMATTPAQIGVVLTQSPAVVAPAVSVACTHPTLTVGSGVPDYTFLTTDAAGDPILVLDDTTTDPVTDGALSLLNDFGLVSSVTWVDQTTTPDVDLGYVISTLPAPGAFVTPGQAITVYGAGYKVPNLVGMTVVNAQAAITALGATKLTNGTVTGAGGTVTSQSPAAFTVVAPGTAVNLVGAK